VRVFRHLGGAAHRFLSGNFAAVEFDAYRVNLGLTLESDVKEEAWHARQCA
jgi:hypothetical protein